MLVSPSTSAARARQIWIRPQQPSVGLLDFDIEHYTTCSRCGSTIDGGAGNESDLVLAGRYELRRYLGSGATAVVYEGLDTKTERPVAVKVFHAAVRAKVSGLVLQEAKLAAAVRNPHLVQASDFGDDQGHLFIVLDLLPGRPLAALMQQSLLPLSEIGLLTLHVLDALSALHRAGVVHRDLKPDNIFIARTVAAGLHATLLDLGFAAVLASSRFTGMSEPIRAVVGTAGYIAPEVFGGHAPDPRSDLYSMGAVLWEALTGQPVPDYRKFGEIVLPSPQAFRPELPDGVAAVVLRALSDIDSRFTNAEEMAAAVAQAFREVEAVDTARTPALEQLVEAAPARGHEEQELGAESGGRIGVEAPGHARPSAGRRTARVLVAAAAVAGGLLAMRVGDGTDAPPTGPEMGAARIAEPVVMADAVRGPAAGGVVMADDAAQASDRAVMRGDSAHAAPAPLPGAREVLQAATPALLACGADADAAAPTSFMIEVACEEGIGHFSRIDVVGDNEATSACAREVLRALRFAPGDPQMFMQEYRR